MRAFCLAVFVIAISNFASADDVVLQDFEDGYGAWTATGNAFGTRPAGGTLDGQQDVAGYRGNRLVNTFIDGDSSTGTLTSPEFEISHPYIAFLIGGGKHPEATGIELLVGGKRVHTATGRNAEMLGWQSWDVGGLAGKKARLRIFDKSTDGFGHINVDQIIATDQRRQGLGVMRLSEYAKTPEYYREKYRPQFHFTPPMNWMNDPNGLVYFDGEYHLFYQHNPHGNSWGHMSWGHAVSKDLVRWQHLPIALHEEYGVMIFSGCCVIDWKNTSGLGDPATADYGGGKEMTPPMVAIYTGHGLGKQTQDIAYSNDRGRTWTKFVGNPVIDKDEADFRDPKVFWHEPTGKWVMVVSMANEKYIEFYGSQDLKDWQYLSKFGPAGVDGKPNWECPDLFELPIEGEPGKSKWVLEVDMGNGSIAGGSGGEYFVGRFDGTRFTCEHDPNQSQWVDYGRDFYAPVSFSDIPKADGRRIWLGWMNNWETNGLPTRPWRSAMSIPRTLSLRKTGDRYRMVQRPVKEMQSLRGEAISMENVRVSGTKSLNEHGITGDRLELHAVFEPGDAKTVGFNVRVGKGETTVVEYDIAKDRLSVDRTNSGESDFHPAFAGKHGGPLRESNGAIELHVFVDTSSIEVFGNDGETVITERIFPAPGSQGVEMFATGGEATLRSLTAWKLSSAWQK